MHAEGLPHCANPRRRPWLEGGLLPADPQEQLSLVFDRLQTSEGGRTAENAPAQQAEQAQQEWDTFRLMDEMWHGGGGRRPAAGPAGAGGRTTRARRGGRKAGAVPGCAIS